MAAYKGDLAKAIEETYPGVKIDRTSTALFTHTHTHTQTHTHTHTDLNASLQIGKPPKIGGYSLMGWRRIKEYRILKTYRLGRILIGMKSCSERYHLRH